MLLFCSKSARSEPVSAPSTPAPIEALAPDIAHRVSLILANLATLVAARVHRHPLFEPLGNLVWTGITRASRRFNRLMTLLAANRLPKPRPPRPHRPKPDAAPAVARARLPTGHLWLIRAIPYEAAALASQLNYLLAACPAAARILRPLCHMLGFTALAKKRDRRKRVPQAAAAPREAEPRPLIPPPPQDPSYRPSAKWPRAHWPRPSWPPAGPSLPKPA
jgi:hypothetical protein